ncbi:MAG: virulence RhuM family protein [Bacteroidales bacterium]|nr:virulence RhuM family protein [Bacteroidales bacterium]
MGNIVLNDESDGRGEIVVYQPDEVIKVEVLVNDETVWLTQEQIAQVFSVGRPAITKHIRNIYNCGELDEDSTCSILEHMGNAGQQAYHIRYYNLDMILSVGYRVNSRNAVSFRRWASEILKEYLLRGYSINQRMMDFENRVNARLIEHEIRLNDCDRKIDFFVRTSLPPVEGVFYDGQIFDAYVFATDLIRSAKTGIILIDNYIDESVLLMLSKREGGVSAEIRTGRLTETLKQDLARHNAQYPAIMITEAKNIHDRFLIVDDDVYHIGASLKDLGKKLFAFSKMTIPKNLLV